MGEYQDNHISDIVENMNDKYLLPHIQRPFVWKEEQIIRLFDSLLRGYPIGTFLFWTDKSGDVRKRKFIENYYKKYSKDFNTEKLGLEDTSQSKDITLVLDGQQRLQSLFIAIKGKYEDKQLYFNLLSGEKENEDGILYEFEFFKNSPKNDGNTIWIKVKDIVNKFNKKGVLVSDVKRELFPSVVAAEEGIIEKNIERLKNALISDRRLSYYDEKEEDYEKVFDIFVRVNSGGTPLSKSDLLFSFIKLKWKEFEAEKEFPNLLEKINGNEQFEFDVDFILKTSLVLIGSPVKYTLKTFTGEKGREIAEKIEQNWKTIKESISTVVDLIRDDFRINNKKLLPSMNALIPVIHYSYKHVKKSKDSFEDDDKKIIKNWLLNILLAGVFSGQPDNLLEKSRKTYLFKLKLDDKQYLKDGKAPAELRSAFNKNNISLSSDAKVVLIDEKHWDIEDGSENFSIEDAQTQLNVYRKIIDNLLYQKFPTNEINKEFRSLPKITEVNEEILNGIRYGTPESYLLLYLIYPYGINFKPSNDANYPQQDHIFSQDELRKSGYKEEDINHIGNIRLITAHANQRKLNTPYAEWIKEESKMEMQLTLIPDGPEVWNIGNYKDFVQKREQKILEKVKEIL